MALFKNNIRSIDIPNPCDESWASMTPVEQGRFCSSCQKCVTNFTSMNIDEIKTHLENNQGDVCGRIGVKQLKDFNHSLQKHTNSKWSKWRLAAATLTGLTLATPAIGQNTNDLPSKPEQKIEWNGYFHAPQVKKENIEVEEKQNQQKRYITGKVIDEERREPIPFVNIHIVGTGIGTTSDFDGVFSLELKGHQFSRDTPSILDFSSVGVELKKLELKKIPNKKLKVVMRYAEFDDLVEVFGYIVPRKKLSIFRRTWNGIKNIFRKKH